MFVQRLLKKMKTVQHLSMVAILAFAMLPGLAPQPARAIEEDYDQLGSVQAFAEKGAKFEWISGKVEFDEGFPYNFGAKYRLKLTVPKGSKAGFSVFDLPKNPADNTIVPYNPSVYAKKSNFNPGKDISCRYWIAPDLAQPDKCKAVDIVLDNPDVKRQMAWDFDGKITQVLKQIKPGVFNLKKATVIVSATEDREIIFDSFNLWYEYPV